MLVGFDVAFWAMRPEAFASDNVEGAVAINVSKVESVRLSEGNSSGAFFLRSVCEEMTFPCAVRVLLKPRDAIAVDVERGDHIGASVAVHIGSEHLCAAFIGRGLCRVGWWVPGSSPAL